MEGVGGAAGWRACAADAWVEQRYDSGGGGIVRTSAARPMHGSSSPARAWLGLGLGCEGEG